MTVVDNRGKNRRYKVLGITQLLVVCVIVFVKKGNCVSNVSFYWVKDK